MISLRQVFSNHVRVLTLILVLALFLSTILVLGYINLIPLPSRLSNIIPTRSTKFEKVDVTDNHPSINLRMNPSFNENKYLSVVSEYTGSSTPTKVIINIVDTPQAVKNYWITDNGERAVYSGRGYTLSEDNTITISIYLNYELLRKYNWPENRIRSEIELLALETLASISDSQPNNEQVQQIAKEMRVKLSNDVSSIPVLVSYD